MSVPPLALPASPDTALPGWYGKLCGLGDFASRRLPPEWIRRCDEWLSACMQHSRRELGAHWLELYLDAPLWRYAWAPGVIDTQWWFGVLMPSCDSVGRHFPLLISQSAAQAPAEAASLERLEQWYLRIAAIALQTLDQHPDAAGFEALLSRCGPGPGSWAPTARPGSAGAPCLPMRRQDSLQSWLARASAQALQQQLAGHSLWWSWLPDQPPGPVRVLPGLPQPEQFSAMLDGRW